MISGSKFDLRCTHGDCNGSCDACCASCCFIINVDALVDLDSPTIADPVGGHSFEARADVIKGGTGVACGCGTEDVVGGADGFEARRYAV